MSMVLINRLLKREKFRSMLILTVHDSLVFDCHVDECLEVARIAKHVMENIMHLSDEVLPGLDWRWLNVPIVAECDAGTAWGSMVEMDPEVIVSESTSEKPLFVPDGKGGWKQDRQPVNTDELFTCIDRKAAH